MTNNQKIKLKQISKIKAEKLNCLLSRAKHHGKISNNEFFYNIGDIADHLKIYDYIIDDNFNDAWNEIANLDTSSREKVLNCKFYNLMQEEYEK